MARVPGTPQEASASVTSDGSHHTGLDRAVGGAMPVPRRRPSPAERPRRPLRVRRGRRLVRAARQASLSSSYRRAPCTRGVGAASVGASSPTISTTTRGTRSWSRAAPAPPAVRDLGLSRAGRNGPHRPGRWSQSGERRPVQSWCRLSTPRGGSGPLEVFGRPTSSYARAASEASRARRQARNPDPRRYSRPDAHPSFEVPAGRIRSEGFEDLDLFTSSQLNHGRVASFRRGGASVRHRARSARPGPSSSAATKAAAPS